FVFQHDVAGGDIRERRGARFTFANVIRDVAYRDQSAQPGRNLVQGEAVSVGVEPEQAGRMSPGNPNLIIGIVHAYIGVHVRAGNRNTVVLVKREDKNVIAISRVVLGR